MKRFTYRDLRTVQTGFTLFELTVAIGAFALLTSAIFALTISTVELGETIVSSESKALESARFIEATRQTILELPASASIGLEVRQSGPGYESEMHLIGHSGAFRFTSADSVEIDRVVLRTVRKPSGYLDLRIAYLPAGVTAPAFSWQDWDSAVFEMTLLRDLKQFEWRVYDPARRDWATVWEDRAIRPSMLELSIQSSVESRSRRLVFWVPPRVHPTTKQPVRQAPRNVAPQSESQSQPEPSN